MKVLWYSNSPHAPTGYGTQTALWVPKLVEAGYEVAIATNYGHSAGIAYWRGVQMYPTGESAHSCREMLDYAADWLGGEPGDGWIFTLYDLWPLRHPRFQRFNVAAWTPVDHRPVPPGVLEFVTQYNAVPVAMSRFGEHQLRIRNLEPLYVPHGIDTQRTFVPGDQAEARRQIGLDPGAFVVVMNAANKGQAFSRKSFAECFAAFSILVRMRPDAFLYLHTKAESQVGLNLGAELVDAGVPADRVLFVDQTSYTLRLGDDYLRLMYQAADVLLAPSMGEGFGIPVIEAQACGCPVIVSDFSAQPELLGDGWLVQGQPVRDYSQHAWLFGPAIDSILEALMAAYERRGEGWSVKAREFAEGYDVDVVWRDHFGPTMKTLEARTPTVAPIEIPSLP